MDLRGKINVCVALVALRGKINVCVCVALKGFER